MGPVMLRTIASMVARASTQYDEGTDELLGHGGRFIISVSWLSS